MSDCNVYIFTAAALVQYSSYIPHSFLHSQLFRVFVGIFPSLTYIVLSLLPFFSLPTPFTRS